MKTALILAGAAMLAVGCASGPPPVAKQIVGTWDCAIPMQQAKINGKVSYMTGGKSSLHLDVTGGTGPMSLAIAGDGEGTWSLLEKDTKFEQSITSFKIATAKLNGNDVPQAMAQPLIDQYLVGQKTVATIEVTKTTLKLTTSDGQATTCTR